MTEGRGESKRERGRRILFDPLEQAGFRKSGKVSAERQKVIMAGLADDLTCMSDQSLDDLRQMLLPHGRGRHHDVWPSKATVIAWAEYIEKRPLEELLGLLRWFASVEGPKALRTGTQVESWAHFHRTKAAGRGRARPARPRGQQPPEVDAVSGQDCPRRGDG